MKLLSLTLSFAVRSVIEMAAANLPLFKNITRKSYVTDVVFCTLIVFVIIFLKSWLVVQNLRIALSRVFISFDARSIYIFPGSVRFQTDLKNK